MGEFMNKWKEYKVSELIHIIGGGTPKTKVSEYWDGDIPWLSVKDFNTDIRKVYDTEKCITQKGLENSSTKLLDEGDVIISARGTVGALAQLGKTMAFNQSCYGLRAKEMTTNDFVYYLLKNMIGNIQQNTHGSVFDTITRDTFDILKVDLPPIQEQKAIAHILSTLDEKIEVNNQINKTLENMAQAIFKQWFVDFEFPNEDEEPYKSSGGEMVESELGMIPKGWEVGNLAESKLTKIVKTGMTVFSGEKIYLATADVDNSNILSKSTKVTHNERPSRANMRPRENTVWFAKMKDSRKLIRVSKKSKEIIDNYIFSTGFAGINVKEGLNYIWSFICSEDFDTRKNNLCNGTTMQAINNSNISNIPLLLPNEEILKKYEDITDFLFESEYLRKKENEKLAEIRDTLLPKLMSGEIRVPLDEEGGAS